MISALISAAIMGILVVMLATLNDHMAKAMLRSNMQRAADNLQRQISGVLAQKSFCTSAIRGDVAGTSRIKWRPPFSQQSFPFIFLNSASGTPTILASKSTAINPLSGKPYNQVIDGLFIEDIKIQMRDLNNDGTPDTAVVNDYTETPQGSPARNFSAVPAEIRITYRGAEDAGGNPIPGTEWVGGALKSRAIPVVLVMDRDNDYVIEKCDDSVAANKDATCTGSDAKAQALSDMGGVAECPPYPCPVSRPVRSEVVVLEGYRGDGTPKCRCQAICDFSPWTWQNSGTQTPQGGWIICPYPAGTPCTSQNQVCTYGSVGPGGKINTRTCQ